MPSIGQNLQPFTGNGDFDEWVKNFRGGRKPQNKQVKDISLIKGQMPVNSMAAKFWLCSAPMVIEHVVKDLYRGMTHGWIGLARLVSS